ncbi:MAG: hydrogenase formation protein HypD [Deltaproteobacteria bacterium]|nr:hydrogenase formation protein HypD [Deltaproteobacteria bacterium]
MKYMDEYRDGSVARGLSEQLHRISTRHVRLMEICGTHTMAIFKHGIRSLLPETIELVSGPGCPVCVTATRDIDRAIALTRHPEVILATFGDMIRVPGSRSSFRNEMAQGADVRMVYSTFDALNIARENPDRKVVFLGIGFETTAPTVAASVKAAQAEGLSNFQVLSVHKCLPPAMDALLSGGDLAIDGFICPGHVTTIIGTEAYESVVRRFGVPCVVTGFEPLDILQGILMLVRQIEEGVPRVEIQYRRAVSPEGNRAALAVMEEVFEPYDAHWRGLGPIPRSGLDLREEFQERNAALAFDLDVPEVPEPPGCRCAEVLRGAVRPPECSLFRKACTPRNPIGPCMVSGEGTCAAYFKYHAS